MTFSIDVVVTEIKADFDPQGGEYTQVCFGYKIPVPRPPELENVYPPAPKITHYKHAVHLIIPREKWDSQYTMWEECHLVVKDDGMIELKKKT